MSDHHPDLVGALDSGTAARVMAVIYFACGGIVAIVASFVPQPPGASLVGIEAICLTGVVLGATVWFLPWDRWPLRASLILAVLAMGFISAFDVASAADGYRYGLFYVVVFAWIGLVQPRGTSLLMIPFLTLAYLGPLLADGHGWDAATASVLYVIPACVVTGEAVAWVSDRLRRTHAELASAQVALVRSERLAAVGEMATVVGHELRNPLSATMSAHYMVRQSLGDPGAAGGYLATAERQVGRAVNLAEDLTAYMREREPAVRTIELRPMVDDVLATTPPPPGIDVAVDGLPAEVDADDPVLLTQMLTNIVTNAYEAMPDGGQLDISGCERDGFTEIAVGDTGEGIDPSVASRLFDPFVTTKTMGTGLGLAIVQRLAEAHHGDVSIENGEEAGAHVILRLPRN